MGDLDAAETIYTCFILAVFGVIPLEVLCRWLLRRLDIERPLERQK